MIEILRKGPAPKVDVRRAVTCPQCKSLLSYYTYDIIELYSYKTNKFKGIICPVCEHKINTSAPLPLPERNKPINL